MIKSNIVIHRVTEFDNLDDICAQMQPDLWGRDNEMSSYQPEPLKNFLKQNGNLIVAYNRDKLVAAALCYPLYHPGREHSLYVHELDTHPEFRQNGIATRLLTEVIRLAKELGLSEVWLAAESNNIAANALYTKLKPSEIEQSVTYTYKVK